MAGVGEEAGAAGDVLDSRAAGGLVIRGGAVRVAGYVVQTALSVLSIALITSHLGVGRFGDYTTALSIITVVAAITDGGMATLAVREYTTLAGAERERLMRNLLGARLALTSLGAVGAVVVGAALGFDDALLAGTALAGIGIGLNVVQSMLAVPLAAELRLTTATLIELARQVVLVALLVACVLAGAGVLPLLAATIPSGVVGLVLTAMLLRGAMPLRPALHAGEWPRLLKLTVPVALTMATGTLYVYLAQVLTDVVASETESGYFAASFRVFIVLSAIPGLVVAAAFPLLSRAARDDEERLGYAIDRLFATTLLGGALISLLVSVGAPVAIDVIAPPEFSPAVDALRIQAWALLASFVLAATSFALLSLRRHREIVVANAFALVTSAVLTLWLAADRGAEGAATATVVGEGVLAVVSFVMLARCGAHLRPSLAIVPKVALATVAGAAVAFSPLPAVPETALAGLVFVVVAFAVRAVPNELLALVPGR